MFDWQNRTDRRAKKEVESTIQKDERRLAMPPKVEATIVVQKCPSSKKLLGVRIQKKEEALYRTHQQDVLMDVSYGRSLGDDEAEEEEAN